jgi:aspartyl-tRNA(Asn)/glutamyl-tRNA(Gln) amidotransferase subunit A
MHQSDLPSCPSMRFLHDLIDDPDAPLDEVDQTSAPAHYTRFGNFLDLCALSLPNGFARDGLPISLQIVCRSYEEATALRIGIAYQDATDWHLRRPPE